MPTDHSEKVKEFIDFIEHTAIDPMEISLYLAFWLLPEESSEMAKGLEHLAKAGFNHEWEGPDPKRENFYTLRVIVKRRKIMVSPFISPAVYAGVMSQ